MTRIKGPYYSTRELEEVLNGIEPYDLATPQTQEWAAAIIAAKDKEVQELKEKLGVGSTERHADAEYIGHLQAELAQIKQQKPISEG